MKRHELTSDNQASALLLRSQDTRPTRMAGRAKRQGLILLVVLGMLALFSLLAVTYVVFSGQSRSASMALARSEIRGQKSHKDLMEEAIMSLVRGPRENTSPIRNHDLLGDLYGASESSVPVFLPIRAVNGARNDIMRPADRDRPLIFGRSSGALPGTQGHFFRIPLDPFVPGSNTIPSGLPTQSDVLNGRVVTFPEGGGPLSGKSFRIVRYIGQIDQTIYGTNPPQQILDQQYTITIDLSEADLSTSHTAFIAGLGPRSGSVLEWVTGVVPTGSTPGFHACYQNIGGTNQTGYQLLLNAAPLNNHGIGVLNDGSSQFHVVSGAAIPRPGVGTLNPEPLQVSTALQPNHPALLDLEGTTSLVTALAAVGVSNRELTRAVQMGSVAQGGTYFAGAQNVGVLGDTDEPYDAADMQDMWASYRESGAQHSFQIIPSFHRPALINYLVNWQNPATGRPKDPRNWTAQEFLLTLYRVHLATLRPLSYQIVLPNGTVQSHPQFTGGNPGASYSSPNLVLDLSNVTLTAGTAMGGNWNPAGWQTFETWLNSLTLGPWDVDNDNDGIRESVFVDPGLPFETSKEGKLLKALVAYYVDDLDSKIDVNATSSLAQADEPSAYPTGSSYQQPLSDSRFAKNVPGNYLFQGRGAGPAETSFRHIVQTGAANYLSLIRARYATNTGLAAGLPGVGSPLANPGAPFNAFLNPNADDALSLIHARGSERLVLAPNSVWPPLTGFPNQRVVAQAFRHGALPGLPVSLTGRASYGLDRLGNPMVWTATYAMTNGNAASDSWNDPYEGPYQDSPFTLAEWERIYRHGDVDASTLPTRLQQLFGLTDVQLNASTLRHMITPYSSHLRNASLALRSRGPNEPFFGVDGNSMPIAPTDFTAMNAATWAQRNGYTGGPALTDSTGNRLLSTEVYHRFDGRSRGANSFYMLVDSLFRLKFDPQGMQFQPGSGNADDFLKVAPFRNQGAVSLLTNGMPYNSFVQLFPMEFQRGLPLNLNRPLGNRVDDDNDGNVDEADEVRLGQFAMDAANSVAVNLLAGTNSVAEQYLEGARVDQLNQSGAASLGLDNPTLTIPPAYQGVETRQLYARHLYCLAQLLIPDDFVFANVNRDYYQDLLSRRTSSQADWSEFTRLRGRILAQWAINAVDIRDADSDMTRFPYDPDPFRDNTGAISVGWDVAAYDSTGAVIGTNVAWGLEQPEMVFSESLATHDLRVFIDEGDPNDATDDTIEQYRKPEGSLFLELFVPRSTGLGATSGLGTQVAGVSPSLYTSNANGIALNVGKVAPPDVNGDQVPVFRVVVSEARDPGSSRTLPSPHARIATTGLTATDALPHDLMYQFGGPAHGAPSTANPDHSGLIFDYTSLGSNATEALDPPNRSQSRIIHFAAEGTYDKDVTPGVDPTTYDAQVFSNQTSGYNAANQITVNGGQYLVIGPRELTYFGSRTTAPTGESGDPANQPNPHYLELFSNWTQMYIPDATTGERIAVDQRPTMRNCVTMIAAIDTDNVTDPNITWGSNRTPGGTMRQPDDAYADPSRYIGISVSEPLLGLNYYPEPDEQLNSDNTTDDTYHATNNPQGTDALGFANLPYDDAYVDYGPNGGGSPVTVQDDGMTGPLQNWSVGAVTVGGDTVIQPGTQLDFCTAYLQRLAYPDKPHDPVFNPYITTDWIPIDLTVFSGEEDDSQMDAPPAGDPGAMRFASREKTGQSLNPHTLEYDLNTNAIGGSTFLSVLTTTPPETTASSQASVYFQHTLAADESTTSGGVLVPVDPTLRPTQLDGETTAGNPAPATFGFLNSTYRLLGDGTNASTVPAMFLGAPTDPMAANPQWRPDAMFWPNRDFVNSLELMWVPTSSPGQIMQEFSAFSSTTGSNESMYAATFRQDDTSAANGALNDPRTPTAPISPPDNGGTTQNGSPNVPGNASFPFEGAAYTPYTYLLNFFQEVPELQQPNLSPTVDMSSTTVDRNGKATSLITLLDMVETPSPWARSTRMEPPANVAFKGINTTNFRDENNAESIILAPLRAPYNELPEYTEPGRININMVSEPNVLFGLGANLADPATRVNPINRANPAWVNFDSSRRGYQLPSGYATANPPANEAFYRSFRAGTVTGVGAQGYDPNSFLDSATYGLPDLATYASAGSGGAMFFNPHFPTRFASTFRPAMEAGMVPVTRNPFVPPQSTSGPAELEQLRLNQLANKKGVLDLYSRKSAAHATLLRGSPAVPFGGYDPVNMTAATGNPITAGIYKTSDKPLYAESQWEPQRNPMTDYSLVTRLQNMTTNRSNVFAVYATIAFFEYDAATGSIGQEYGADSGEAQRYRAFYVIDRSKPVGYQSGEDHNAGDTIVLRRYLKTDD